ncbi:hypothetical protein BJX96DRAFT_157100 [Aspergillus floccosus]
MLGQRAARCQVILGAAECVAMLQNISSQGCVVLMKFGTLQCVGSLFHEIPSLVWQIARDMPRARSDHSVSSVAYQDYTLVRC